MTSGLSSAFCSSSLLTASDCSNLSTYKTKWMQKWDLVLHFIKITKNDRKYWVFIYIFFNLKKASKVLKIKIMCKLLDCLIYANPRKYCVCMYKHFVVKPQISSHLAKVFPSTTRLPFLELSKSTMFNLFFIFKKSEL